MVLHLLYLGKISHKLFFSERPFSSQAGISSVMYDHAIIEFLDRMVKEYQKIGVWWK